MFFSIIAYNSTFLFGVTSLRNDHERGHWLSTLLTIDTFQYLLSAQEVCVAWLYSFIDTKAKAF